MTTVQIKNKVLKNFSKPYIIAEACINHEGNLENAFKMIEIAKESGAHCIKFQIHNLENEMLKDTPQSDNFKETLWDALERTNFNIEKQKILKEECENFNIDYLCTPFSFKSADILEKKINLKFFKTGSGELTNHPFQIHVAKKRDQQLSQLGCPL